ncbi:hypothetical protein DICVIV_01142 [Dictyocaulus viviparus]|uniref:non-specific serine/threonine protein kinase n=1 Tax=Dictyocaulus viviparus TaxID=29172 RepID=A0A0D8YDL5_DICVI|nr:hypothetical protein DICVIV_01142 [Dictyocaulus viviparus]
MGVMLYKLCYFSLPFGESAMAIQSGVFSFPTEPDRSDAMKAIIKSLLDVDADKRPSIYQCSVLAFAAAGRVCPIVNNCHKPSLSDVIHAFHCGVTYSFDAGVIVSLDPVMPSNVSNPHTTSVQPRLRPKPIASTPITSILLSEPKALTSDVAIVPNSESGNTSEVGNGWYHGIKSNSIESSFKSVTPSDLGFTDLETTLPSTNEQTNICSTKTSNHNPFIQLQHTDCAESVVGELMSSSTSLKLADKGTMSKYQSHRRNTSDTSHVIRSAFKPYSQWKGAITLNHTHASLSSLGLDTVSLDKNGSWNPFLAAPFGSYQAMDDSHFGKCFDELPRKSGKDSEVEFNDENNAESIGLAFHLHERSMDDDSEYDEQRMVARRRFSYENIDGVGDDASSDSRGRTDHDSTDDISKNEESSYDEFKGDGDSSQHTDVVGSNSDDDCTGSRPLLEDDALDDDEEVFSEIPLAEQQNRFNDSIKSLFVDLNYPHASSLQGTNPFLSASDDTPKISPVLQSNIDTPRWKESEKVVSGCYNTMVAQRSSHEGDSLSFEFAPATLPRQSTALTATPRVMLKSSVNAELFVMDSSQDSSITSCMPSKQSQQHSFFVPSSAPFSEISLISSDDFTTHPVVGRNLAFASVEEPTSSRPVIDSPLGFVEGSKTRTKKSREKEKKRMDLPLSSSEIETDGSEAEMCTSASSDKASISKRKKKSFVLLGSNPTVAPLDLKMSSTASAALLKKSSVKRSSATNSSRKGSNSSALNASFVNSSFLAEDLDSNVQQFIHL